MACEAEASANALLLPTACRHLQFGLLVLLQCQAAAAGLLACPGSVVKPTLLLLLPRLQGHLMYPE